MVFSQSLINKGFHSACFMQNARNREDLRETHPGGPAGLTRELLSSVMCRKIKKGPLRPVRDHCDTAMIWLCYACDTAQTLMYQGFNGYLYHMYQYSIKSNWKTRERYFIKRCREVSQVFCDTKRLKPAPRLGLSVYHKCSTGY